MSDELHDFGTVDLIGAESVGQPGSRRFRLYAQGRRETASLWLEKQQIEELSLGLDQLLAQATGGEARQTEGVAERLEPEPAPDDFPIQADVEFQVAGMQIGYDEARDVLALRAPPLEMLERDGGVCARADAEPQSSARFSRRQALRLSRQLFAIISAGRPRCLFCGQPI